MLWPSSSIALSPVAWLRSFAPDAALAASASLLCSSSPSLSSSETLTMEEGARQGKVWACQEGTSLQIRVTFTLASGDLKQRRLFVEQTMLYCCAHPRMEWRGLQCK